MSYNSTNPLQNLLCGAPQDSILGPLFFYVYINDLANVCKHPIPLLFADDTNLFYHYDDVIMGAIASQIISLTIVYSIVYSGTDHRKHQSSALLALVRWVHRGPVISPHKGPVTRKMFPFDDVIMCENDNHTTDKWRTKFISEWLKINRISRNVKNTHYIIFATRRFGRPNSNVKIEGHTTDEKYQIKFLGVIIDDNRSLETALYTFQRRLQKE